MSRSDGAADDTFDEARQEESDSKTADDDAADKWLDAMLSDNNEPTDDESDPDAESEDIESADDAKRQSTATDVRGAATGINRPSAKSGPIWVLRDSWTEAERHLRIVPRNIELIIYATIQPVMFVLLFVFVFGGAIVVPGYDNYEQFLIPGVFAQTIVFGSSFTSLGIAEDMQKGYIDRLRSLPMARSAVLIGRTFSDLLRNVLTFVAALAVAFAVGFRFEGTLFEAFLATCLLLGFSYSLSWIQALIGLSLNSVEAANSAGFVWMFPLTFVSSAFVDPRQMPTWLQPVARNNPFTVATNACRALYNGLPPGNDVYVTLAWTAGVTVVFAILSIGKFSRSTVA